MERLVAWWFSYELSRGGRQVGIYLFLCFFICLFNSMSALD